MCGDPGRENGENELRKVGVGSDPQRQLCQAPWLLALGELHLPCILAAASPSVKVSSPHHSHNKPLATQLLNYLTN